MSAESLTAYQAVVNGPCVRLGIKTSTSHLTGIDFIYQAGPGKRAENPLAAEVVDQLSAYFRADLTVFSLPVRLSGTDFQRRVWQALQAIPLAGRLSYGELAKTLRSSPRAVGGACRANPIPLVVPCHRVISQAGLGGFAGHTDGPPMQVKRWLLAHEAGELLER